jgi:hypothetical protein
MLCWPSFSQRLHTDSFINHDIVSMADSLSHHPMGNIYHQAIPADGPDNQPDGPRSFTYVHPPHMSFPGSSTASDTHPEHMIVVPGPEPKYYAPNATELYNHAQNISLSPSPGPDTTNQGGAGANHYPSANGVPRLPPILQVEKQQVTTSATQLASASRRRNEANFACPVPGCGSTFTRRFNLRGSQFTPDIGMRPVLTLYRPPSIPHRRTPVRLRMAWL